MKYLYAYKKVQCSREIDNKVYGDKIKVFTPKLWRPMLGTERKDVKSIAVRLVFQLTTRGKARIYYVCDGENLVHTSYVVPKCRKFPFLDKNDYEIGPCFTYPEYRGKGVYPEVLRYICDKVGNSNTTFYMIVDESNISSVKGIEKAGFEKCGVIKVSKYMKRYQLVQL